MISDKLINALSMHERVVTLINGKIVSLEVDYINYRIAPGTEKEDGFLEYSGYRRDKDRGYQAPYEVCNVKFTEEDLGRTIWKTKEDMLKYLESQEVEPDYWK